MQPISEDPSYTPLSFITTIVKSAKKVDIIECELSSGDGYEAQRITVMRGGCVGIHFICLKQRVCAKDSYLRMSYKTVIKLKETVTLQAQSCVNYVVPVIIY